MDNEIQVLKNEEKQQPIPSAWRRTLREIVEALSCGDFQLSAGIAGVRQLSMEDAGRISRSLETYGAHLASLPEETWETSACQWMRGYWDVLVDLYTIEDGASDLVLAIRVYEEEQSYIFEVISVHVP